MYTAQFWMFCLISAVISYLLGSFNFAIIVSKIYEKDDVRLHGSGNAGMSNMLRTFGKKPAVLTAAGDFLKAVAAILISRAIFSLGDYPMSAAGYAAGLFVLIGHLFPLYFGFRGGKGVMTTLGVILMVNPVVFIISCVIFIPIAFVTKYISLASILGAASFPIFTFAVRFFQGQPFIFETCCAFVMAFIILFVHRSNIQRLLNGTENGFGKNKK